MAKAKGAARSAPVLFPENRANGPGEAPAVGEREFLSKGEQANHSFMADVLGNLVRHEGSGRVASAGVGKAVEAGEPGLAAEGERFFEIGVRLPGATGDHVGRDGGFGDHRPDAFNRLTKFRRGVATAHGGKGRVTARLQSEMEMRHEPGVPPQGKELGRHVLGLERAEAHPGDVGRAKNPGNEIVRPKSWFEFPAPGAELGPGDHDFARARPAGSVDLGNDGGHGARLLAPPRARDDAEGADIVAALLGSNERACMERNIGLHRNRGGQAGRPRHEEVDQCGPVRLPRAHDEVGPKRANRIRARRPRITAGDSHGSEGRKPPGGAHQPPRPRVGGLGNGAGVEDEGIGLAEAVHDREARALERSRDLFADGEVELAAKRDYRREGPGSHGTMVSGTGCPVQPGGARMGLEALTHEAQSGSPLARGSLSHGGKEEMSMDAQAAIEAAEAAAKGPGASMVDRLASRLGIRAQADAVFAAPVERDGVTVIPVAKVRTGFGGGGGSGPAGNGEGGGGGVMASPLGYIEMTGSRATFRPIFDPGAYAGLIVAAGISAWLTFHGLRSIFR